MFYFNQTCIPTIPQEKLGTKPPTTITGCCSVAQLWPTLCAPMDCSTPGFPVLHHFLELVQTRPIESVMPSNHLILCCPFLLPPSIFSSIRWPKYWWFSFSISPSNEYSGLISLRMDWFDLLSVQVTLKSLLQHHSSKASILHYSAFFMIQLSHPYMTTEKTIAFSRWNFVSKSNVSAFQYAV